MYIGILPLLIYLQYMFMYLCIHINMIYSIYHLNCFELRILFVHAYRDLTSPDLFTMYVDVSMHIYVYVYVYAD